MNCSKCGAEMLLDHTDKDGNAWHTCMNRECPNYKVAVSGGNVKMATIKPKE